MQHARSVIHYHESDDIQNLQLYVDLTLNVLDDELTICFGKCFRLLMFNVLKQTSKTYVNTDMRSQRLSFPVETCFFCYKKTEIFSSFLT